LVYSPASD